MSKKSDAKIAPAAAPAEPAPTEPDVGKVLARFVDVVDYLAEVDGPVKVFEVADHFVVAKTVHQAEMAFMRQGPFKLVQMDRKALHTRTVAELRKVSRETPSLFAAGGGSATAGAGDGDREQGNPGSAES